MGAFIFYWRLKQVLQAVYITKQKDAVNENKLCLAIIFPCRIEVEVSS